MKKKPVRVFNILGVAYKLGDPLKLDAETIGLCDFKSKQITISDQAKGKILLETLIHEIIHAKDYESGLYQVLDRTGLEVNAESVARVLMANFHIRPKKLLKR